MIKYSVLRQKQSSSAIFPNPEKCIPYRAIDSISLEGLPKAAIFLSVGIFFYLQWLSFTRALQRSMSKTGFWWTSIKCIHDNNGVRIFRNHYFNFNSQSSRVALSSLLYASINRNWEVRLIKSFEVPFRSSRSRAMFWSCKLTELTNSVQPQQHETELNVNNNLYINPSNLFARPRLV